MTTQVKTELELYIDSETHSHQISEDNTLYRIAVKNTSDHPVEDVTLALTGISPLRATKDIEPGDYMEIARLKALAGLPLLVMHDRAVPPKTLYALNPGESLSADLVQYNKAVGMFVFWHAQRKYNRRGDGLLEEVQHPDPFAAVMDYKVSIVVKYWQNCQTCGTPLRHGDDLQAWRVSQTITAQYEVGVDEDEKFYFREGHKS